MILKGSWQLSEKDGLSTPVFILNSKDLKADTRLIQPHFVQPFINLDDQDRPQMRVDLPDLNVVLGIIGPFTPQDQVKLDQAQRILNTSILMMVQGGQQIDLTPYCTDIILDFSGDLGRAVRFSSAKQYPAAIQKLEKMLQASHGSPPTLTYYELGRCHLAMGQFDRALECFALELKACQYVLEAGTPQFIPFAAMPFNSRGVIFKKQQRFAEAISAFEAALKLRPNYFEALISYLTLMIERSSEEQIMKLLARAFRCQPEHPAIPQLTQGVAQFFKRDGKTVSGKLKKLSASIDLMQPTIPG